MSGAVVGRTRPPWVAPVLGAVVVVATLVCAAVALDARGDGLRYGSTSLALLIPLPAAIIATAGAAWWLAANNVRFAAGWLAITSGTLFLYLASIAFAVQHAGVAGRRGIVAELAVAAHGAGALVPVAVLQLCLIAALAHVTVATTSVRRFRPLLVVLTAAYLAAGVLFVAPGSPYDDMRPIWDVPAMETATSVMGTAIWIATVLIGPILIWRAAAAARSDARRRLSLLAACALTPVVTITFCIVGMSLAYPIDLMSVGLGEALLAVAYCIPFIVAAVGIPAALHPDLSTRSLDLVPKVVATTVTVVVGLLFGIVVVTASAFLGVSVGREALLAIVVLTLAIAAALAPIRRRLTRRLVLGMNPARAIAARLTRRLDDGAHVHPAQAVEAILRESLTDPTARLVIRLPDDHGWVDAAGAPAGIPPPGATPVPNPSGADPLAYVVHDGSLSDASGAIEETQTLISHAVLEVTIRERSERIAAEKERADQATTTERRRLERDLHDGVQGRLLALALDLRMAQRTLADADAQLVLSDATDGLQRAIEELRTLASGATPELLSEHGLGVALAELSRRIPIPVSVSVPPERLSRPVEAIAYLIICEAVTNALKHARAHAIAVNVAVGTNTASIEVSDDGRGGADLRMGTGLRGMSERVVAAGGRLIVSNRHPSGTTVEVTLPCGS